MHAMDFIPEAFRLVQPPAPPPRQRLTDDEWFWRQDRAERELMTYPEDE